MLRSFGQGTLVVALLGAGLAWGQQPAKPAPVPTSPTDHIITVEEPGKPAQKCKVLKTWKMKDGTWAREVQSLDNGEIMTIVEGGSPTPAQASASGSRFQSVASRIFHWGRSSTAPMGVPIAPSGPGMDAPMIVMPSTPASKPVNQPVQVSQTPVVPALSPDVNTQQTAPKPAVGVAQPSDWRKSWGIPDDHQTKVTAKDLPPANYNANVPARPTQPLKDLPLVNTAATPPAPSTLPPANYSATTPAKPVTQVAQAKTDDTVSTTPKVIATIKKDTSTTKPDLSSTAKKVDPAKTPAKPEATAQAKPASTELPKAETKKPDPLRAPEQFTRRPLETYPSLPKGTEEKVKTPAPTPAALASKTPAPPPSPPVQQVSAPPAPPAPPATAPAPTVQTVAAPAPNSNAPLPAGAQSVLAAGVQPGQVVYVPVPIVTLPSGYRPQPPEGKPPQAPQPNMPPQRAQQMQQNMPPANPFVVTDDSLVNAFSPNEQEVAAVNRKMNPSQMSYVNNNAFAGQVTPQQVAQNGGMPMGQGMYPNGYRPGYPAPMNPGMYAQGGQAPMGNGLPPAAYGASPQMPYPPDPYGSMAPGMATVSNNAMPNVGVMQAAFNQAVAANPSVMLPPTSALPTTSKDPDLQALFMVLRDSVYPSQREWAADKLSGIDWRNNPQVVQALLTSAREDTAATVRAGCVRCLAKMNVNTPPVVVVLQGMKNDADLRVRQEIEQTLTGFGQTK